MKLHEVTKTAIEILLSNELLNGIAILTDISQSEIDTLFPADKLRVLHFSKTSIETAVQGRGLALVLIQESGSPPDPKAADLLLNNMLIVSVLENQKTNANGPHALEVTGLVLKAIHQHNWSTPGLKNVLTVDNPAYTRGELDSGLTTYFCNFQIKTIE